MNDKNYSNLQQVNQQMYAELLAEQARLIARVGEITAILSYGHLPPATKTAASQASIHSDLDRQAYAIGLIWRNPNISVRELAQKVGVSKSTLFLPNWSDVAKFIKARKNVSANSFKDHHLDKDDDE